MLHNQSMSSLDQKIYLVAYYLQHYSFPQGFEAVELSAEEKEFLCEKFSIRFKQSSSGLICFYGSMPGRQGMGDTAFRAFCLMIKNLGFKIHKNGSLCEQLQEHFQQIA